MDGVPSTKREKKSESNSSGNKLGMKLLKDDLKNWEFWYVEDEEGVYCYCYTAAAAVAQKQQKGF